MDLQEPDAERRNLCVTSLAIIAYYFGEGRLEQDVLKLPLINIQFLDIHALIIMLWVGLFWFLFRYWLKHRYNFSSEFHSEMSPLTSLPIVRWYFHYQTNFNLAPVKQIKPIQNEKGFWLKSIDFDYRQKKYHITYFYRELNRHWNGNIDANNLAPLEFNDPKTGEKSERGHLPFKGFTGKFTLLICFMKCISTQPSFSSYVVPYILFVTAFILGCQDLITSYLPDFNEIFTKITQE